MKVKTLQRKYTIENYAQYQEFEQKIKNQAKTYLDMVISGGRKEVVLRFTGERLKKNGFGFHPDFSVTNAFNKNCETISYDYALDKIVDQLMKHEDESMFNEPVILF